MDPVARLVRAPRGRRLCAEVAEHADETGSIWTALITASEFADDAEAEKKALTDSLDSVADTELTKLTRTNLLLALDRTVASSRYWQPPDEVDVVLADPALDAALTRIGAAVLGCAHSSWWGESADLDLQRAVQWYHQSTGGWSENFSDRRTPSWTQWHRKSIDRERRAQSLRPAAFTGTWWSSPATTGCLSTTRAVAELAALQLDLTEDALGWTRARVWRTRPTAEPRIYEIGSPEQWAQLVELYPLDVSASKGSDWFDATGRIGPWLMPNWAAVAEDHDAVHLSVLGYLTTAGVVVPAQISDVPSATMLAGWDPDETYWLDADALDIVGEPVDYEREDDRWTPTVR